MDKMDIQTWLFLEQVNSCNEPELDTLSIEEERRKLAQSVLPSPIKSLSIFDYKISSSETQIPLRIYVPKKVFENYFPARKKRFSREFKMTRRSQYRDEHIGETDRLKVTEKISFSREMNYQILSRRKDLLPVYVSMHGGGWVFGSLDSHDAFCRSISEQARVIVVSIDYRLAPEHKYPAAFNDCYEAVNWVAKNIQNWSGDASKLIIGGISAGGNLAAAVALKAKESKFPIIKAQVLICPVMQYSFDTHSYQKYADGYFLTKRDMEFFWNQYLEKVEDGQQAYASPLLAPDVSKLPSTLIVLAEFDPLYDEGSAYGEKMKTAGVSVKINKYPTYHGFMSKINEFDISKKAITDISEFLKFIEQSI